MKRERPDISGGWDVWPLPAGGLRGVSSSGTENRRKGHKAVQRQIGHALRVRGEQDGGRSAILAFARRAGPLSLVGAWWGLLRMWKVTLGLLLVSLALAVAFFAHGMVTGTDLPYPDPTPTQAAHERFHRPIGTALFLAAGISFVACLASGVVTVCINLLKRQTPKAGRPFPPGS
jgi:multisubunit Na+/H+ antiporter MnhC subunit